LALERELRAIVELEVETPRRDDAPSAEQARLEIEPAVRGV
jgi:hypothetical protein